MILAEIADKMLPTSLYIGAALLFGVYSAVVLAFLNGYSRLIGFGIVAFVAAFLAWALQIDADLIEAARNELGQYYLIISRYWLVGAVAIAITFFLILRTASRSKTNRIIHPRNPRNSNQ